MRMCLFIHQSGLKYSLNQDKLLSLKRTLWFETSTETLVHQMEGIHGKAGYDCTHYGQVRVPEEGAVGSAICR